MPWTAAVVGTGVVGDRVGRLLSNARLVGRDRSPDVTVLATPGPHAVTASELARAGAHVVCTSGSLADVRDLIELDDLARANGATIVVGAAVSPGLSGLLARYLHDTLGHCDELHIAAHGTAGPSCAREHHDALGGWSIGWHDDGWVEHPSGSGRELCWFPEPVGARDCYRAELPDPMLLHDVFPSVERISARLSATRRDRFTARLPMLSPPHREGGIGALRVEARGCDDDGARQTFVIGVAELVGTAAAAVATAFAIEIGRGTLPAGAVIAGDGALPTASLLASIRRGGVRFQTFTGIPHPGTLSGATGTLG